MGFKGIEIGKRKNYMCSVRMSETMVRELEAIASCLNASYSQAIRDSIHAAYLRVSDYDEEEAIL